MALAILLDRELCRRLFICVDVSTGRTNNQPILLGLSAILFCGSIFVYTVVSYSFTTIVQLKTLVRQEKYNALHDPLTNLPNRKHCIETIELLIEHDKPFDLMLLDVVNFKQVNDGMGHFCGDQLLVQIGQRISSLLEKGDFIAG